MKQRRLARTPHRFGLLPFRSPLLRESSLFLEVLRCFSSPGSPRHPFGVRSSSMTLRGLPHSDTSGSPVASTSPERFAAWLRPSSAAGAKASTVCPYSRTFPLAISRLRPPRGPHRPAKFLRHVSGHLAFSASSSCVCGRTKTHLASRSHLRAFPALTPVLAHVACVSHRDTRWCRSLICQGTVNMTHVLRLSRSLTHLARWSRGDSNPGPPPCKGGALPAKLRPRAGGRAWTRTRDLGLIRAAL